MVNPKRDTKQNSATNPKTIKELLTASPKNAASNESMLLEILGKIDVLTKEVIEVKKEIANVHSSVRDIVIEELTTREEKWNKDRDSITQRLEELEQREEMRVRQEKKKNIIIKGYPIKTNLPTDEIHNLLAERLGVQVVINRVTSIKTTNNQVLLVVELASLDDKYLVLNNKMKLKGSELFISSDRTKKERAIQREIAKLAEEEKNEGKNVKIGYRKLITDGVTRIWKEGLGLVVSTNVPETQMQQSFRA